MPVASRSSAASDGYSARLARPSSSSGPGPSASICGPRMPAAALDASAPGMPRATTVTLTPRGARRNATAEPMMPPPMIATSVLFDAAMVRLARSDAARRRFRLLQLALQRLRHPHLVVGVDD